ncbi:Uncharacterised protein [Mycobacteroides abscessus subsp. abscessus]|nr:Uncharacterised protein [Mycobacteroides abscessus subsp. abscessus]
MPWTSRLSTTTGRCFPNWRRWVSLIRELATSMASISGIARPMFWRSICSLSCASMSRTE